jgi:hypothetical protein
VQHGSHRKIGINPGIGKMWFKFKEIDGIKKACLKTYIGQI